MAILLYSILIYTILNKKKKTVKHSNIQGPFVVKYAIDDNGMFMMIVYVNELDKEFNCCIDTGSSFLVVQDTRYKINDSNVKKIKYASQSHHAEIRKRNYELSATFIEKNGDTVDSQLKIENFPVAVSNIAKGNEIYNIFGISRANLIDPKSIMGVMGLDYFAVYNGTNIDNSGYLAMFNYDDIFYKSFDGCVEKNVDKKNDLFVVNLEIVLNGSSFEIPFIIDTGSNYLSLPRNVVKNELIENKKNLTISYSKNLKYNYTGKILDYIEYNDIDSVSSFGIIGSIFMKNLSICFGRHTIKFGKTSDIWPKLNLYV